MRYILILLLILLFPVNTYAQQAYGKYKSTQTLSAGSQIDCLSGRVGGHSLSYSPVVGSGGPVDLTSNPQIKTTGQVSGDMCYIIGTNDTNTVKLDNGNGMVIDQSLILGNNDVYSFVYNGTNWVLTGAATQTIQAGQYAAGSIDGDDINTNYAGAYLTQNTGNNPDTMDVDTEAITDSFPGVLESPVTTDDNILQYRAPVQLTITEVSCWTDSGTVTIQLEERASTTPNTTGTNVMTSALVCDTNVETTTNFSNAGISNNNFVSMIINSLTGTPGLLKLSIKYRKDDV